mmetsp:Transcript_12359/g.34399  ORF Transcript_12359/g.34399 Transcript_12359/m.34399 type:complete len:228 (-) Transcript_12359:616-1299(-)
MCRLPPPRDDSGSSRCLLYTSCFSVLTSLATPDRALSIAKGTRIFPSKPLEEGTPAPCVASSTLKSQNPFRFTHSPGLWSCGLGWCSTEETSPGLRASPHSVSRGAAKRVEFQLSRSTWGGTSAGPLLPHNHDDDDDNDGRPKVVLVLVLLILLVLGRNATPTKPAAAAAEDPNLFQWTHGVSRSLSSHRGLAVLSGDQGRRVHRECEQGREADVEEWDDWGLDRNV